MNNKLVVVTDLGSFKAYKLEVNGLHKTPRLELIEEFNLVEAHGKMSDRLSDLAGRYHAPALAKPGSAAVGRLTEAALVRDLTTTQLTTSGEGEQMRLFIQHTSTGPLGTGRWLRWAGAGSCMREAARG